MIVEPHSERECRRFCVLTHERSGSTALMDALAAHDDIATPNKDVVAGFNELLHRAGKDAYARAYAALTGRKVRSDADLIEAFYAYRRDAPFAGFKLMPAQYSRFASFVARRDVRFVVLVRDDFTSTVASLVAAQSTGRWRGEPGTSERWAFSAKEAEPTLRSVAALYLQRALLATVEGAIRLTYEDLCRPDFGNPELDAFFGRRIALSSPKPPGDGADRMANWTEFCEFVDRARRELDRRFSRRP